MHFKFLILAGAMCMPAALVAQVAPTPDASAQPARTVFDKADAEQAVVDLATALEENFVFPDCARTLRRAPMRASRMLRPSPRK